ncbi:PorP/SprF family type IX secretion system membrane protein [Pararhodonellum marinum]|uniref:PorP/SprF family type IX secretion system membrane protein n=1 Tax=Pararhodonellum marinum TaxID=2755358 RepID=UPI00188E0F94|nr:PorP/SprF family type IX secretion system membrane protein [Pararhodonellum marinum]
MMGKLIRIALFLCLLSSSILGQDMHYSQFYAAPLYLNPAFAGSTELSRVGLNYRKQWPGLAHDFNMFSAYFDHYSYDMKSGFGVAFNSFHETNMDLKMNEVSFFYSYKLTLSEGWDMRFGGQGALVMRNAALDNLLFGDQINLFTQTINPNTMDNVPEFDPYSYFDVSFGTLLQGQNVWMGTSMHHMNTPSLSFFPDNDQNLLPMKWSIHGGANFGLGSNNYFGSNGENMASLAFNYKRQGPFQQLDVAGQLLYGSFIGGLSFRGIPGLRGNANQDSLILLLGLKFENGLVVGYSYDFMISNVGVQTRGAHEISLRYQFLLGDPRSRDRRSRVLRCFDYLL